MGIYGNSILEPVNEIGAEIAATAIGVGLLVGTAYAVNGIEKRFGKWFSKKFGNDKVKAKKAAEEIKKNKQQDEKILEFCKDTLKEFISAEKKNDIFVDYDTEGLIFAYLNIPKSKFEKAIKNSDFVNGDDMDGYAYWLSDSCGEDNQEYLYFKNKHFICISADGWGNDLIYCKEEKKFYYFDHENSPQFERSDGQTYEQLVSNAKKELLESKFPWVKADAELGYYRLSEKPKE